MFNEAAAQSNTFHKTNLASRITAVQAEAYVKKLYALPQHSRLELTNTLNDKTGAQHLRYNIIINNMKVEDAVVTVHLKNGLVENVTGFAPTRDQLKTESSVIAITSEQALTKALNRVNAQEYAWENSNWEKRKQNEANNTTATWKPKGILVYAPRNGNYRNDHYVLAYRFDVYSTKPLSRQFVFVNAATGEVMYMENQLCEVEVPGTAQTAYSGTQSIQVDQFAGGYRLRETARGGGIETWNMETGTDPGAAVDFIDDDNDWNNVNAAEDQYATDAHWGAEMTYDYYLNAHNRNSVDDNGLKIICYVHEDFEYFNAFWDGGSVHFGDGDAGSTPLTCLDIVGHELTHGVTEFSAGLNYQDESGALNESFSDIFGTVIEFQSGAGGGNFLMGEQTGNTIRSMSNPNTYGDPDTYNGTNWYNGSADNGGVHTNSGVQNKWFYLLSQGGSGTNDLGDVYTVNGLGMATAAEITYRALTVYLFPSANYNDARSASIQAAVDLFGACTPEVESVTNAWYAVGVGSIYVPQASADFSSGMTGYCEPPASVSFNNISINAASFTWYFGDGNTSTEVSPTNVYNQYGSYTVTLIADGGAACGVDTMVMPNYIQVDSMLPCITTLPFNGSTTVLQCSGLLFDSGGPADNYTDEQDTYVTIAPPGATGISLTFADFSLEDDYDYVYLYDGDNASAPLIDYFTGAALPNSGNPIITGPVVTIRLTSDWALNEAGFQLNWECITAPPTVDFAVDNATSCSGWVQFQDQSQSSPTSWEWDFGDGTTSTEESPLHFYAQEGTYDVTLVATNAFGSDTMGMTAFITIDRPAGPDVEDGSSCLGGSIELGATPTNSLSIINWYDATTAMTSLGTGSTFNTPSVSATTTFYAEETINYPQLDGGLVDNSLGGSFFDNNTDRYLIFDVYTPVKLLSVKVYADGDAMRTIELRDASGNVLQDTSVMIADGEHVINVNFMLPVQNDLQLGIGGVSNLFRNNGTANYPYDVPGILTITGSNATPAGYYYYFYDWKLQQPSCISERVPVEAIVGAANVQFYPQSPAVICNGNPTPIEVLNGTTFLWSTGETTSTINPTTDGNYSVTMTDINGCTGTNDIDVTLSPSPVANFNMSLSGATLNTTNTSSGATDYTWYFGDGTNASSTNPSHIYLSGGVYTVMLIASNGSCNDTMTNNVEVFTSINSFDAPTFHVYPNPTDGNVIVELNRIDDKTVLILTDVLGRIVLSQAVIDKTTALNISDLATGVYQLTLRSAGWERTEKLVKQ